MAEDNQEENTVQGQEVDEQILQQEAKAKRFGWVPKEDFHGPEDSWRPADEFLKRGEEINGYLRKDLEKIERADSQKAAEIAELRETMEEFRKYHQETEARAYKRALDELKAEKAEAIEQGDGAKVIQIDDQIDTIKEAQKPQKPQVKEEPQYNKEYREWAKANLWYTTDPELKALAELIGEEVPHLKGKEFLDEVTRRVKEAEPEKFNNPNRRNAAVGTSSDGRQPPSTSKKKSYANLPADAKAACDKFVKQKLMTQEQYVSEFEWD